MKLDATSVPTLKLASEVTESDAVLRHNPETGEVIGKGAARALAMVDSVPQVVTPEKGVDFPTSDYVHDGYVLVVARAIRRERKVKPTNADVRKSGRDAGVKVTHSYPTCVTCGKNLPVNPAHVHKCAVAAPASPAAPATPAPASPTTALDAILAALPKLPASDRVRIARAALA